MKLALFTLFFLLTQTAAFASKCVLAKPEDYQWCQSLLSEDCSQLQGYDHARCQAYLEKRCDLLPERDQRMCQEIFARNCTFRQPSPDDRRIMNSSPLQGPLNNDYWFCRAVTENCSLLYGGENGYMCLVIQNLLNQKSH